MRTRVHVHIDPNTSSEEFAREKRKIVAYSGLKSITIDCLTRFADEIISTERSCYIHTRPIRKTRSNLLKTAKSRGADDVVSYHIILKFPGEHRFRGIAIHTANRAVARSIHFALLNIVPVKSGSALDSFVKRERRKHGVSITYRSFRDVSETISIEEACNL